MPKAFAPLCGEPLLAHALRGAFGCGEVGHVIVVSPASYVDHCRDIAAQVSPAVTEDNPDGVDVAVDVVVGGADRSGSVEAGMAALCRDDDIVLVHDVARCLAPSDLFGRVIASVRAGHSAVVPGVPVTDTIKVVDTQGSVLETPDRESLRGIQTPQGFLREVLEHAHSGSDSATDDAGLVERAGGHVCVVAGDHRALKITSPFDIAIATALLQDGAYAG